MRLGVPGAWRVTPGEASRVMFQDQKGRLATVTGIDVRDGIDILYHWCFDSEHYIVTVKALAARPSKACIKTDRAP